MATKEKEELTQEETKAIHIYTDKLGIEGAVHFDEFVQLVASALLQMMNSCREDIVERIMQDPKQDVDRGELTNQITADIYDGVNLAFSNVLEMFAPEFIKRPGMTEAILKCEDEIIKAAADGDKAALRIILEGDPEEKCEDNSEPAQDAEQN